MIGIISVTKKGDNIADKLSKELEAHVIKKSNINEFSLDEVTSKCFKKDDYIIFISSTGIAVRAIAKYLKSKAEDPGVVVVDVCGKFTISLVSGHLGGANELARKVAGILDNVAIITTATDNLNKEAPDVIAVNNSLVIEDLKKAKYIASLLVNDETVYFMDDKKIIECPYGYTQVESIKENMLWITNRSYTYRNVLKLIRKDIVIGIGCKKNVESEKVYEFVQSELQKYKLSLDAVRIVASIDIKKNEKAILDLAHKLNAELKFYNAKEIEVIEDRYEGIDFVKKQVGVRAVSEPVVELSGGKLMVNKIKKDGITLSIGYLN